MLSKYHIVDLSIPLAEELPCSWPGHVPYRHTLFSWFAEAGSDVTPVVVTGPAQSKWLMLPEHTGTHFDAPTHFIAPPDSGLPAAGPRGSISVEEVPVEQLVGPAVVVDVRHRAADGVSSHEALIVPSDVTDFEAMHGAIAAGDVVLLQTGWDRYYRAGVLGSRYIADPCAGRTTSWPSPTAETVELLADRGVQCIGIDAPSVGGALDGVAEHHAGLVRGVVFVEGLGQLDELPARGATFLFLPVKIRRGTGAPGRAVGFVPVSAPIPTEA